MDKEEAIAKVSAYKRLLSNYLEFDSVYLFGSFARGTQKPDSDIDVAIVLKHTNADFFEINPLLWRIRRQVDDRIEPVLIESDYDEAGFLDEIKKHGICIM